MNFETFLALRFLRARQHAFINLITILSMAGVALGVCALIVVLSVMGGFERQITKKLLGLGSHLTIYQVGGPIENPERVLKTVAAQPGVVASIPYVYGQVMLVSPSGASGAIMNGLELPRAAALKELEPSMISGSLGDLAKPSPHGIWGIVLGSRLARQLGLGPGMMVTVINPLGEETPVGRAPKSDTFKVVGIFESGLYQYDASICYVNLAAAQQFLEMAHAVNGVEALLTDIYQAPEIGRAVASKLGPMFYSRDWMTSNQSLFSALKLERFTLGLILALIILVASFGIVSSLIMMVMVKTRDIGVLKAMGATRAVLRRVFMLQGMIIGVIGTALGTAGGLVICWLLSRYKFIELPKEIYGSSTVPMQVEPLVVAIVAAAAIAISLVATLYPARVAGSLDPVQALRYE